MTDRELTVPYAPDPLEVRLSQMERWIEGWVDPEGKRHPGLIEMVSELHAELKARRERREEIGRVLASGSLLALLGFVLNWFSGHLK